MALDFSSGVCPTSFQMGSLRVEPSPLPSSSPSALPSPVPTTPPSPEPTSPPTAHCESGSGWDGFSNECTPCLPGTVHLSTSDDNRCEECPEGYYSENFAGTTCFPCPDGLPSDETRSFCLTLEPTSLPTRPPPPSLNYNVTANLTTGDGPQDGDGVPHKGSIALVAGFILLGIALFFVIARPDRKVTRKDEQAKSSIERRIEKIETYGEGASASASASSRRQRSGTFEMIKLPSTVLPSIPENPNAAASSYSVINPMMRNSTQISAEEFDVDSDWL